MNKVKNILFTLLATSLLCASCQKEDDISELFEGKTWYITNGYIQGRQLVGDDIKTLCAAPTAFQISFSQSTFIGTLNDGNTVTGKWEANGKTKAFSLSIRQEASTSTQLEGLIYNTLKKIIRYEGDTNIMKFYADDANYIGCGNQRSPKSIL